MKSMLLSRLFPKTRRFFIGFSGMAILAGMMSAEASPDSSAPFSTGRTVTQESFPDMPTYNIFTNEELGRDFSRLEHKAPLGHPALGFFLVVPKTWEEVPLTVSRDEFEHDDENIISLALIRAPEKKVQVEVAYLRVPKKTDLEAWVRAYLKGNGLELLRFQKGTFSGRQVFDTLLSAPGDYKIRMTFSLHEDKIFIVSGSAPTSLYEKYMKVFGVAVVSFRKM